MEDLLRRIEKALSGRYEIEDELGRGGMAIVFRAHDVRHERIVAVKVLPPHLASAISSERFLHEIKLAAGLVHPYIVPILDSGEADGLLYYVMPLIEGETLANRLHREGPLPVREALTIAREIAEALAHAHASGVVHRDVKPSNILLTREHALLSDFGVARARARGEHLTGTGVIVGTPAYMSPQQAISDEALDGRADQYSLACVAYEMLAGRAPFTGPSPEAVLLRHATRPLPPLRDACPALDVRRASAIERALAKNPADRFPTMGDFRDALTSGAESPASTSSARRAAGVLLVGLVAVLAAWGVSRMLAPGASTRPEGPTRIAVLPCRVFQSASHPGDSLLSRNTASQVSVWLDRIEGVTAVPPEQLRNLPVPSNEALPGLADSLDLATLVSCSIDATGEDSVTVTYDEWSAGQLSHHRLRLKRAAPGIVEAGRFAADLVGDLVHLPTAENDRFPGTDDEIAFQAFLEGDHAFDQGRLFEAESLFARAYRLDPAFVLARWRQVDARRWQLEPSVETRPFGELYAEFGDQLGTRSSLLLSAVALPAGPSFARFETILTALPDDWYAHLLYGDELLHRGPLFGFSLERAEEQLRTAVRLNPRFAPAWDHLALALMRQNEPAASDSAIERLSAVSGSSAHDYPIADLWRHAWLETFRPEAAVQGRGALVTDTADLPTYARMVRYFDLPRLQLALGLVLTSTASPGSVTWHSGVNAIALAHATLGRPREAHAQWLRAAEMAPPGDAAEARLFAAQWAVVPAALGLEGFRVDADAVHELGTVIDDQDAPPLLRTRAAWTLALAAARSDASDGSDLFELRRRQLRDLTSTYGIDPRMANDVEAVAAARERDWRRAIDQSTSLLVYDSAGIVERPFNRAAFHLQRGDWYANLGREVREGAFADSARAAWIWFQNTDIEGVPDRRVQAAEVDGALGSHARLRLARLADELNRPDEACDAAIQLRRHWAESETSLGAARSEAAEIEARRCPRIDEGAPSSASGDR